MLYPFVLRSVSWLPLDCDRDMACIALKSTVELTWVITRLAASACLTQCAYSPRMCRWHELSSANVYRHVVSNASRVVPRYSLACELCWWVVFDGFVLTHLGYYFTKRIVISNLQPIVISTKIPWSYINVVLYRAMLHRLAQTSTLARLVEWGLNRGNKWLLSITS